MAERRRRGYGEGSIYKLRDGRWRGAVELGWSGGRRRRKQITRKTRAEVVREMRKLASDAEAGLISPEKSPTVAEWMATYLKEVAPSRVRASTLYSYRMAAELHIVPSLGRIRLNQLRPQHLTAFYREMSVEMAPSSVRRLHAVLRRALTVAMRWGLIQQNPALLVDPPSMARHEVQPYTVEEARGFLGAAAHDRLEARWVLGLTLGLRQGETLGLSWQDIDLEKKVLRVRGALQRQPDGSLALVDAKTPRSRRSLPLPPSVLAALQRRADEQHEERKVAGRGWRESDLVFTTAVGTPIHPRNDYRSFQRLTQRAGLRRVRLHDLRHTAASLLLAQGVPARVVMEILGHSQISVTMNTYTHVDATLNRAATDRMEAILWPHDRKE